MNVTNCLKESSCTGLLIHWREQLVSFPHGRIHAEERSWKQGIISSAVQNSIWFGVLSEPNGPFRCLFSDACWRSSRFPVEYFNDSRVCTLYSQDSTVFMTNVLGQQLRENEMYSWNFMQSVGSQARLAALKRLFLQTTVFQILFLRSSTKTCHVSGC